MIEGVGSVGAPDIRPVSRSTPAEEATDSSSFGSSVSDLLSGLGEAEARADNAALAGATGELGSVSEYMIAATEAQLMTEVTVAVRNRAVEAFTEIMRMQV